MKSLIIVDMENEWFIKESEYYVGEHDREIDNINCVIDTCRSQNYNIIFIRHLEPKNAFVDGTVGAKLLSTLHKEKKDIVIKKTKVSPFYGTSLEKEVKGSTEIVICGILTNMCVRSTVADAYDRDFCITVIEDACIAVDKRIHKFTLDDLKKTRPEITICTTKEFVL